MVCLTRFKIGLPQISLSSFSNTLSQILLFAMLSLWVWLIESESGNADASFRSNLLKFIYPAKDHTHAVSHLRYHKFKHNSFNTMNSLYTQSWNWVNSPFFDCNWTRTNNHLVRKRTLNRLAALVSLAKWLSVGLRTKQLWVRNQLKSLKFTFRACFEQGAPWHSVNYRVWIHSETRTWHDEILSIFSLSPLPNCFTANPLRRNQWHWS